MVLEMWGMALLILPTISGQCPTETLVVYKMQLETFWDEEIFPKQYPQWRPSAQWSKTVGYSHGQPLSLFSLGKLVGQGVRQFVETADSEVLDREAQNRTFLDTILSSPIPRGVGLSSTNVFVDGNHSKISLMTKLVPSPDWFIGLDSLELCQEGSFLESFTTEAFPLDAGTDNGFTFTSPNWETEPRGEVFTISNSFPAHPAGSFHYPHLTRLPRLAQYSLTKLREYEMKEDFTAKSKVKKGSKYHYDTMDKEQGAEEELEFVPVKESRAKDHKAAVTLSSEIPWHSPASPVKASRKLSLAAGLAPGARGFRSSTSVSGYHASTAPDQFMRKRYSSPILDKAQSRVLPGKVESKASLYSQILASYGSSKGGKIHSRHKKSRLRKKKRKRERKPRNCNVSSWSSWGSCSKSCGIGESVRRRTVTQRARHGGMPCPSLTDYRWCGSARNCKAGYFKW